MERDEGGERWRKKEEERWIWIAMERYGERDLERGIWRGGYEQRERESQMNGERVRERGLWKVVQTRLVNAIAIVLIV